MAKCIIIVPWGTGQPTFPGLTVAQQAQISGWTAGSYAPPPAGTANYVLVWLDAAQSVIDILAARSDCLLVCNIVANPQGGENIEAATLTATQRNDIRAKIAAMGFTGAQYGLLNAAIQASQNRDQLAVAIATKAFFRHANKTFMVEADMRGAFVA